MHSQKSFIHQSEIHVNIPLVAMHTRNSLKSAERGEHEASVAGTFRDAGNNLAKHIWKMLLSVNPC